MLASDSDSILQEQRKKVKKSTPRMAEQKHPKSPLKVEDIVSTKQVPIAVSPTKEKPDEVMIYIENVSESLPVSDEKEVVDNMEIEDIDER